MINEIKICSKREKLLARTIKILNTAEKDKNNKVKGGWIISYFSSDAEYSKHRLIWRPDNFELLLIVNENVILGDKHNCYTIP